MSDPFIAEVRIFTGNFAPRGWAFCNGQLLPIAQNTALFSLVGTTYGGDGRSTFGLPNLEGRMAMHPGRGPGLTARRLGQTGGTTSVTLTEAQMPNHTHTLRASAETADLGSAGASRSLARSVGGQAYVVGGGTVDMATDALDTTGGSQAHNNLPPYLVMNYIIALQGTFPSRS